MRSSRSLVALPRLAITVGDTTAYGATASGAIAWSTTLGALVQWDGSAWELPSASAAPTTPYETFVSSNKEISLVQPMRGTMEGLGRFHAAVFASGTAETVNLASEPSLATRQFRGQTMKTVVTAQSAAGFYAGTASATFRRGFGSGAGGTRIVMRFGIGGVQPRQFQTGHRAFVGISADGSLPPGNVDLSTHNRTYYGIVADAGDVNWSVLATIGNSATKVKVPLGNSFPVGVPSLDATYQYMSFYEFEIGWAPPSVSTDITYKLRTLHDHPSAISETSGVMGIVDSYLPRALYPTIMVGNGALTNTTPGVACMMLYSEVELFSIQ